MKLSVVAVLLLAAVGVAFVAAQDPAEGWLGYAMGVSPTGTGRITFMEAKWTVGQNPVVGGAFFCKCSHLSSPVLQFVSPDSCLSGHLLWCCGVAPWFGIEASDNLNLIQPVNPWVGDSWQIYNEYFQWSPENNIDSDSTTVNPGDVLYGSVTYVPENNTYTIYHSDLNSGWSVYTSIPIQQDNNGNYKNYTIAYIVYEKDADCNQYPPDGQVTFSDITIQYDGVTVEPSWTTAYVDDVCNNRAKVSVCVCWFFGFLCCLFHCRACWCVCAKY